MAGMAAYPHCYPYSLFFFLSPSSFLFFYAIVLKKGAMPAIVSSSPHKQAENSMAGCCNNLP
jgi:hypothetical protein